MTNNLDPRFAAQAEKATQQVPFVAFGKLSLSQRYLRFGGKGTAPVEIDRDEYDQTDDSAKATELIVEIDAAGVNPQQRYPYKRRTRIGSKDWKQTVAPSILSVFGSFAEFAKAVSADCFVAVRDTPQIANEDYSSPKFVQRFASMDECARACAEHYQPRTQNANGDIPADVLDTARAVWKVINNETTFRAVASQDQKLAQYDVEKLIAAIKS